MASEALLIQFTVEPPAALFAGVESTERMARLGNFYRKLKLDLERRLAGEPVEIADLRAIGAVIVRGSHEDLERLRKPGGPLDMADVRVVEDASFVTT